MKKEKKTIEVSKSIRPATNPKARENQMIALAVDLAEKQLLEGSASSQVITHYLRLASDIEKTKLEKLKYENELIRVKTEALESSKRIEELYSNALDAMRRYSGRNDDDDD